MGAVYRGHHQRLKIDVAVKCLKPSLASEDERFISRFRREANLAAEVSHENLVRVYDVDEYFGLHYIVFEFVEGETAKARVMRKGPLSEIEAATIILGVARGLARAHRHARVIVHRDIKPDNILISHKGEVKLADLGIAKSIGEADASMLGTQGLIGTPSYMAPEQWISGGTDHQSTTISAATDVWALGATLFFLLTGRTAFGNGEIIEVGVKICKGAFPSARIFRPDLSRSILHILEQCTRYKPSDRFCDAHELALALDKYLGNRAASLIDSSNNGDMVDTVLIPNAATPSHLDYSRAHRKTIGSITFIIGALVLLFASWRTWVSALSRRIGAESQAAKSPSSELDSGRPEDKPAWRGGPATPESARVPHGWDRLTSASGFGGWAQRVREPNTGVVFNLVSPGAFQMGSPESEEGRSNNEEQHYVEITAPFYLGETEVTQAQFRRHRSSSHPNADADDTFLRAGDDDQPILVSWFEASAYCEDLGCELPTEAQWEYACRAGGTAAFSFGAKIDSNCVNCEGFYPYVAGQSTRRNDALPAKSFPANAWGFYEMHGNVSEWCRDAFRADYQQLSLKDPYQVNGESQVVRGGSWYDASWFCRAAYRGHEPPYEHAGFRVAKSLQAGDAELSNGGPISLDVARAAKLFAVSPDEVVGGTHVTITLTFDEDLRQLTFNGSSRAISGRVAQIETDVPAGFGPPLELHGEAQDTDGNSAPWLLYITRQFGIESK